MGRTKKPAATSSKRRMAPARDPEERINQLIALSYDAAEKQLREGTASSQVITHFLKLATTKEELENEKLKRELELLTAKTESLQSQKRAEDLLAEGLAAFRKYSGHADEDED